MFVFFIPLIINFLPLVFQVKLSRMRIKDKTNLPLYAITLISFALVVTLSFVAFIISMWALPPNTKCAVGCTSFLGMGALQFFITTPLIAIVSYLRYTNTHKTEAI
jgi:protein-S-isoprenylcysteine O-methyltransferase Ste14